jgi:VCBS repeat-containing protein
MFVGSHAETGDERKAAAALLPYVIGSIQTAAGCGTLRHASGTAAQAMVGDPRSRARTGGFGMLWLTALTFSIMKEVQAADPNVTFLDDGSITYKDLEHGAFELVTKEAIPRHIIVEDPGETIVLRPQGSTISVNQVTNSATRMAELQAAQQDALATFEKGLGSTGSSTPPFVNPLPVQPINFIQTDGPSPAQNSLEPLPTIVVSVPEIIVGRLPPPPPTPPTLNAVTGPIEIDTVAFDVFTATSGTLVADSSDSGAPLTFGISGGTAGSTVLDGVTYDVSKTGPYGTLYVNSTTGAYTFVPDSGAINALTAPTTTSFTVTVSDGTLSADQIFTIAINGTNDAAIISGITTGSAIEAGGAANATLGTTATGTLTDTDVDNTPNTFTAVNSPTTSAGGYGTFTMTAAGVWTYTLNEAISAVQALNVGDTLTDTFTVTTVDGTAQVVTITIDGTNDAAVISGTTTGSVIEDDHDKCGSPTATGTLTDTDVDNTPNTFTAVGSPRASAGGYGTFTMTAAGVWTYILDEDNCAVRALDVGDTLTDTFTVTTVDGTAQVVTITIHGASNADPNDFDHLATGKAVICDPPYVYGTPRDDTIAGGGHHAQIVYAGAGDDTINGTGKCDLIYAGSGNDTIKGNDGDDTIYGGSGGDTINGNNGCDTIVGGYGADNLTGSNGNDRFVYLSVADSNAARFDVISDFRSGSDRIDLTALGALAFLALTSTSTSVPAHTIAWFYDSTTNETVVYVNPTDQTLSIGDSGLLEIHLEGIATIQASDFVPEPTVAPVVVAGEPIDPELTVTAENDAAVVTTAATDVSLDWTGGDSAHLADGNETVRTIDVGYSRDEARPSLTDDAEITPESGQSIEQPHLHATRREDSFAFDQATGLDSAVQSTDITALNDSRAAPWRFEHGQTLEGDGWIVSSHTNSTIHSGTHSNIRVNNEDHWSWIVKIVGSTNAADTHAHTIDTGFNGGLSGVLKVWENAGGGRHSNSGESNKHDAPPMHGVGAPDFEPSSMAHAVFGSGAAATRGLGDSFHFKGEISSSEVSDLIDHAGVNHNPASIGHHENAAGSSGPLAISEGTQTLELSPTKHHSSDNFSIVPDQAVSAFVSHLPHDLMV